MSNRYARASVAIRVSAISFIYPGCGYGGSCFPKDVQALARTAKQVDYPASMLNAVET